MPKLVWSKENIQTVLMELMRNASDDPAFRAKLLDPNAAREEFFARIEPGPETDVNRCVISFAEETGPLTLESETQFIGVLPEPGVPPEFSREMRCSYKVPYRGL
jgi:hypothetical protein